MEETIIKNNLIFSASTVAAVYRIEPIDLIILPEQEQLLFQNDMRQMLASLQEGKIQIIMKQRKSIPADLSKHFNSFSGNYSESEELRINLIKNYIAQLSQLVENNIIPQKEYYLVFSEKVAVKDRASVVNGVANLEKDIARIAERFQRSGIDLAQLTDPELIQFISSYTRP